MRDVDFDNFCRMENCTRQELHPVHDRPYRCGRGSFIVKSRHLIIESTLKAVSERVLKPFSAIFAEVLDDYGDVKDRTVYRALSQLIDRREVGLVVPRGSASKLRAGGFVRGGYIRMASPLLMQVDGLLTLMDQAEELCLEMSGSGEAGRNWFVPPPTFTEDAFELVA